MRYVVSTRVLLSEIGSLWNSEGYAKMKWCSFIWMCQCFGFKILARKLWKETGIWRNCKEPSGKALLPFLPVKSQVMKLFTILGCWITNFLIIPSYFCGFSVPFFNFFFLFFLILLYILFSLKTIQVPNLPLSCAMPCNFISSITVLSHLEIITLCHNTTGC